MGILDSYSLIEVVVRIEDELKFAIPDEQLTSKYFGTLRASALCVKIWLPGAQKIGTPSRRDQLDQIIQARLSAQCCRNA